MFLVKRHEKYPEAGNIRKKMTDPPGPFSSNHSHDINEVNGQGIFQR